MLTSQGTVHTVPHKPCNMTGFDIRIWSITSDFFCRIWKGSKITSAPHIKVRGMFQWKLAGQPIGVTRVAAHWSQQWEKIQETVCAHTCPWLMYTWTLPSSLMMPVAMGAPTSRSDKPSAFRSTAHTLEPKYAPSYTNTEKDKHNVLNISLFLLLMLKQNNILPPSQKHERWPAACFFL